MKIYDDNDNNNTEESNTCQELLPVHFPLIVELYYRFITAN